MRYVIGVLRHVYTPRGCNFWLCWLNDPFYWWIICAAYKFSWVYRWTLLIEWLGWLKSSSWKVQDVSGVRCSSCSSRRFCLYFATSAVRTSLSSSVFCNWKSARYPAPFDRLVAVVLKIFIPGCSRHYPRWQQGIPQRKYWAFARTKYTPARQAMIVIELFSDFSVVLAREPRCCELSILSKKGRSQTDHTH